MDPEEPLETHTVREIFVDGFSKHAVRDGIMTCIGYRKLPDGSHIVVRLAWPVVNTCAAIYEATAAIAATEQPQFAGVRIGKRGFH